VVRGLAY